MTDAGSRLIHTARLVSGGVVAEDAWVRSEGGRVVAVGTGPTWTEADAVIDAVAEAGPAENTGPVADDAGR